MSIVLFADDKFSVHPPSMIGAASITAAVGNSVSESSLQRVVDSLHVLTSIETVICNTNSSLFCLYSLLALPVVHTALTCLSSNSSQTRMHAQAAKGEEAEPS